MDCPAIFGGKEKKLCCNEDICHVLPTLGVTILLHPMKPDAPPSKVLMYCHSYTYLPFFAILLLIYLWPNNVAGQNCNNPDSAALMALYVSADGSNWTNRDGWGVDCDVCTWFGVFCSSGRVTRISLFSNNMVGTIPVEIGNLDQLEALDLAGNDLSGTIPNEIGSLTNLEVLNLGNNLLSGIIPNSIWALSNLRRLQIRSNDLTGLIPSEIGQLVNLEMLSIEYNDLSGEIPTSFGNLVSLQTGNLSNNNFVGELPSELGNLASVITLSFAQNALSGSLPSGLGGLDNLRSLSLNNNLFTGTIPISLADLFQSTSSGLLQVQSNDLSGCVPPQFQAFCSRNVDFRYHGNSCLWQGSFEDFCNGDACTFDDYQLTASPSQDICLGDSTTLIAGGGISYEWSTGETSSSIEVAPIASEMFYVSIVTQAGCVRSDSIQIKVNDLPVPQATGVDASSPSANDGSADVSITSGEPPYSILWSNGSMDTIITGLSTGVYYVTVSDANLCSGVDSVVIGALGCPSAGDNCDDGDPNTYADQEDGNCNCVGTVCPDIHVNLTLEHISCFGEQDGGSSVSPDGGTTPYDG